MAHARHEALARHGINIEDVGDALPLYDDLWTEVKSGKTTGWVKMLSLQLARGATQRRADNGLRSLFNVAQTAARQLQMIAQGLADQFHLDRDTGHLVQAPLVGLRGGAGRGREGRGFGHGVVPGG